MKSGGYDYFAEFRLAIERTKKLGMTPEDFHEGDPAPPQDAISGLVDTIEVPLELRAHKGPAVHHEAYAALAKKHEVEITIGNVSLDGVMQYPATCGTIKKMAKHGKGKEQPITAHAWLTLPDGTILDYCLPSVLAAAQGAPQPTGQNSFLHAKPEALPEGIAYHPYLIGVEFLYNCKWVPPDLSGFPQELLTGLFPGKM